MDVILNPGDAAPHIVHFARGSGFAVLAQRLVDQQPYHGGSVSTALCIAGRATQGRSVRHEPDVAASTIGKARSDLPTLFDDPAKSENHAIFGDAGAVPLQGFA